MKRTLKSLFDEVLALLPAGAINAEWADVVIDPDDAWVEFYPFVLSKLEDGWELADGDPICNWAGQTFGDHYPEDADAKLIAERIVEASTAIESEVDSGESDL